MLNFELHSILPEGLQEEWNELLAASAVHVPFLRYEYLRAWWEGKGGGEWPDASLALVTARRNGRLAATAPLFHTSRHKGGAALLNLGSIEISDYLDILAGPDDLIPFLDGLLPFLVSQPLPEWQGLHFYNLLEDSPTLPGLKAAAGKTGMQFETEQLQHSPYIPLPGDWEQYLAGIDKKQRHEIRRKMRRAEESETPVRWYIVESGEGLDGEIDEFLNLMEFDEEKAKFLTPAMREQIRRIIHCASDSGCLQLAFLQVDGAKAAGYLSFDYLNRLWIYNSGIHSDYRDYSPGWVLLGYLLKWANENRRAEFDFMRGNEDYKYRFGAIDRYVVRASLLKN